MALPFVVLNEETLGGGWTGIGGGCCVGRSWEKNWRTVDVEFCLIIRKKKLLAIKPVEISNGKMQYYKYRNETIKAIFFDDLINRDGSSI